MKIEPFIVQLAFVIPFVIFSLIALVRMEIVNRRFFKKFNAERDARKKRIAAWSRWRIHHVGIIVETEDGAFPSGWVMESVPGVPLIKHIGNGQVLIGGYTISELREMTTRPSEFET